MDTLAILTVVLFSVGAVQGIIFGFVLARSNNHNKAANRFLAAILFLFSYRLIVQTLRLFGLGYYDEWYYVMIDLSWISGPLLYFYVKALISPQFRLSKSDWVHILPVCIQICMSVFVRLQNLYWDGTRESLSWAGYWGYVVWMNYSTIYIVASILIIVYAYSARKLLIRPSEHVEIDQTRISWIKKILASFGLYFSAVLAILLFDLLIYNVTLNNTYYYFERFYYYPFFGGLSVLTYWIGLEGFNRKDERGLIVKHELSALKKSQLEVVASKLKRVMEQKKLYNNPTLTLADVALELDVKPYVLSNCLKEVLHTRFNDYINSLRVAEVQRLLRDPENGKFTLLTIAFNAGFNSKSSFNRSIKKHLGISPSELRKSHLAK